MYRLTSLPLANLRTTPQCLDSGWWLGGAADCELHYGCPPSVGLRLLQRRLATHSGLRNWRTLPTLTRTPAGGTYSQLEMDHRDYYSVSTTSCEASVTGASLSLVSAPPLARLRLARGHPRNPSPNCSSRTSTSLKGQGQDGALNLALSLTPALPLAFTAEPNTHTSRSQCKHIHCSARLRADQGEDRLHGAATSERSPSAASQPSAVTPATDAAPGQPQPPPNGVPQDVAQPEDSTLADSTVPAAGDPDIDMESVSSSTSAVIRHSSETIESQSMVSATGVLGASNASQSVTDSIIDTPDSAPITVFHDAPSEDLKILQGFIEDAESEAKLELKRLLNDEAQGDESEDSSTEMPEKGLYPHDSASQEGLDEDDEEEISVSDEIESTTAPGAQSVIDPASTAASVVGTEVIEPLSADAAKATRRTEPGDLAPSLSADPFQQSVSELELSIPLSRPSKGKRRERSHSRPKFVPADGASFAAESPQAAGRPRLSMSQVPTRQQFFDLYRNLDFFGAIRLYEDLEKMIAFVTPIFSYQFNYKGLVSDKQQPLQVFAVAVETSNSPEANQFSQYAQLSEQERDVAAEIQHLLRSKQLIRLYMESCAHLNHYDKILRLFSTFPSCVLLPRCLHLILNACIRFPKYSPIRDVYAACRSWDLIQHLLVSDDVKAAQFRKLQDVNRLTKEQPFPMAVAHNGLDRAFATHHYEAPLLISADTTLNLFVKAFLFAEMYEDAYTLWKTHGKLKLQVPIAWYKTNLKPLPIVVNSDVEHINPYKAISHKLEAASSAGLIQYLLKACVHDESQYTSTLTSGPASSSTTPYSFGAITPRTFFPHPDYHVYLVHAFRVYLETQFIENLPDHSNFLKIFQTILSAVLQPRSIVADAASLPAAALENIFFATNTYIAVTRGQKVVANDPPRFITNLRSLCSWIHSNNMYLLCILYKHILQSNQNVKRVETQYKAEAEQREKQEQMEAPGQLKKAVSDRVPVLGSKKKSGSPSVKTSEDPNVLEAKLALSSPWSHMEHRCYLHLNWKLHYLPLLKLCLKQFGKYAQSNHVNPSSFSLFATGDAADDAIAGSKNARIPVALKWAPTVNYARLLDVLLYDIRMTFPNYSHVKASENGAAAAAAYMNSPLELDESELDRLELEESRKQDELNQVHAYSAGTEVQKPQQQQPQDAEASNDSSQAPLVSVEVKEFFPLPTLRIFDSDVWSSLFRLALQVYLPYGEHPWLVTSPKPLPTEETTAGSAPLEAQYCIWLRYSLELPLQRFARVYCCLPELRGFQPIRDNARQQLYDFLIQSVTVPESSRKSERLKSFYDKYRLAFPSNYLSIVTSLHVVSDAARRETFALLRQLRAVKPNQLSSMSADKSADTPSADLASFSCRTLWSENGNVNPFNRFVSHMSQNSFPRALYSLFLSVAAALHQHEWCFDYFSRFYVNWRIQPSLSDYETMLMVANKGPRNKLSTLQLLAALQEAIRIDSNCKPVPLSTRLLTLQSYLTLTDIPEVFVRDPGQPEDRDLSLTNGSADAFVDSDASVLFDPSVAAEINATGKELLAMLPMYRAQLRASSSKQVLELNYPGAQVFHSTEKAIKGSGWTLRFTSSSQCFPSYGSLHSAVLFVLNQYAAWRTQRFTKWNQDIASELIEWVKLTPSPTGNNNGRGSDSLRSVEPTIAQQLIKQLSANLEAHRHDVWVCSPKVVALPSEDKAKGTATTSSWLSLPYAGIMLNYQTQLHSLPFLDSPTNATAPRHLSAYPPVFPERCDIFLSSEARLHWSDILRRLQKKHHHQKTAEMVKEHELRKHFPEHAGRSDKLHSVDASKMVRPGKNSAGEPQKDFLAFASGIPSEMGFGPQSQVAATVGLSQPQTEFHESASVVERARSSRYKSLVAARLQREELRNLRKVQRQLRDFSSVAGGEQMGGASELQLRAQQALQALVAQATAGMSQQQKLHLLSAMVIGQNAPSTIAQSRAPTASRQAPASRPAAQSATPRIYVRKTATSAKQRPSALSRPPAVVNKLPDDSASLSSAATALRKRPVGFHHRSFCTRAWNSTPCTRVLESTSHGLTEFRRIPLSP